MDFTKWDHPALKALYEQKLQELSADLLKGASWAQVQDKRILLVELSKQLSKAGARHNPAEQSGRNNSPAAP